MNKAIFAGAILALCLLSGCGGDNLPTEIQDVGDTIVKEQDLLETHDIEETGGIQSGPTGDIDLTQTQDGQMTPDMAKEWIADCISGEYEKAEDGDIITETASMKDGGTARITTYCGFYYSTEFRYPVEMDGILEKAEACLCAYIGRDMTDLEKEELQEAMSMVSNGSDAGFVSSMSETAYVYVFIEDGDMVIQCS